MADTRTNYLNLYAIGAASDNVGVHMITHYNFNVNQLDSFIASHDIASITTASGVLTITTTDGTTFTVDLGGTFTGTIAAAFDDTATYAVGDYCIYGGALYKCTAAHSGTWDADNFTATTVVSELASIIASLDAEGISYDNTNSGLAATDVQDAIDEVAARVVVDSFNGRTGAVVPTTGDYNIDDMGDVTITSPTDGQALTYDSNSGEWINSTPASALTDLTDVTISSATEGDTLQYDSSTSKWVNVPVYNNAGFHNSVYRGKYLGSALTDDQSAAITAGTFDDLFIGDYWTINSVNYRIAAFDYYYNTGDTVCTTHHAVIVPDTILYNAVMNSGATTSGAYVGSAMYTTNLATAKSTIESAFGSSHILSHRQYLKNAVTDSYETAGAWYDSTLELMTEQNVYGGKIFGNDRNGTNYAAQNTIDKSQYPLFAFDMTKINIGDNYWLRDVASATYFCNASSTGNIAVNSANTSFGVRPAFAIY